MDAAASPTTVEDFLEHFLLGALGLSLQARIHDLDSVPASHRSGLVDSQGVPRQWAAWQTDKGPVSGSAIYDHEQSQRIRAHVLFIEWWMVPYQHHQGWWHCDPKHPREWTKGRGDSSRFSGDEAKR